MMNEGLKMHQVVILPENIRMSLEITDTRVVAPVALGGTHDVTFPLPRTCRRVAHSISQRLRTTGRSKGQIVFALLTF